MASPPPPWPPWPPRSSLWALAASPPASLVVCDDGYFGPNCAECPDLAVAAAPPIVLVVLFTLLLVKNGLVFTGKADRKKVLTMLHEFEWFIKQAVEEA